MIFWRVTNLLHRLSTCFLLFDFLWWKRGRMAKALRCSLVAGIRRAGSNPVLHRRSLWTWMSVCMCVCAISITQKQIIAEIPNLIFCTCFKCLCYLETTLLLCKLMENPESATQCLLLLAVLLHQLNLKMLFERF